jgi:probable HAF family extracellular repeat protein
MSFALSSSGQVRRYKVIDTGTFGGPNGHMSIGTHILNDNGTFTGFADTADPDPYAPGGCWDGDCLVAHVSKWQNGELIDLGALDGGPNSESNWISENGWIAGDSQNGLLDPFGGWEIRAVVWDMFGKLSEVGTLDGGHDSLARAVNSTGEVVGLSTTTVADDHAMIGSFGLPFPFQTRAYRWRNGNIQDLGTLGGTDAMAVSINESGQIIGNSYTSSDPSPACSFPGFDSFATGAFLWKNGAMTNLGSLGGSCTNATAINNRGQVVGYSYLAEDATFHPFIWDQGSFRDLGTTGDFGYAATLNDAGDVVGWQASPDGNAIHATLWSRGSITDLEALAPDQCSIATGINSRKQVVGLSGNCNFDDPSLRAFIWEPGGQMVDLNTLISPSLGIQLRNVAAINDRGEMAAVAFFSDGSHRPVLLVPCATQVDDCQDTGALKGASSLSLAASTISLVQQNAKNQKFLPNEIQAVLAMRRMTHTKSATGK